MRIILHVGINKTGTSSLQSFLSINADNLARHGWVYPQAGLTGAAHHGLAAAAERGVEDLRKMVKSMEAEAAGKTGVILSSEALHDTRYVGRLHQAFSGHDVEVVIFLRDYLDYLSSWYREDVQSSALCSDFENYAVLKRKNYISILRRWAKFFGAENLHIRDYNRDTLLNRSSIDEVMIGILGIDDIDSWNKQGYENNPSVSGNLLFFKRIINNYLSRKEATMFNDQITDLAKSDPSFRSPMRIKEEFGNYLFSQQYREDLKLMKEEFNFTLTARPGAREGAKIPDHDRMKADYDKVMAECERLGFSFSEPLRKYMPSYLTN